MKLFNRTEPLIELPTTAEGLDAFVAAITKQFGLPDTDDTYESIATLILHMPQSSCAAPLSFFGNSVKKSMANAVAYPKLQEFGQKRHDAAQAAKQVETAPVESTPSSEPVPVQNT